MPALGSNANHKRKRSNAVDDDYIAETRGNRRKVLSVASRDATSQRELRAKTQDSGKKIQRPSTPEAGPSTKRSTNIANSTTRSHSSSPTRSLTISIKDSPDSNPKAMWEIESSEDSDSSSESAELVNRPQWMCFNETERLEALAYEAKTKARAKKDPTQGSCSFR
jgi:hypothetical protein